MRYKGGMPLAALCLALLAPPDPTPVALTRKFVPGEKLAYSVTSHITAEEREKGLQTFIPEDLDINYGFDFTVQSVSAAGIATVRYERPTMTEIEGETATSPPKTKVEKVNAIALLTISPINALIDYKNLTPKKTPAKKPKTDDRASFVGAAGAGRQGPIFEQYIGEMHRLALFIGSIDSGLDFAPKFSLDAVKVGDTWPQTVGYQPQRLSGTEKGKAAVQRLDYILTYLGPMTVDGKKILRVQAKLDLKTDLADYLKTLMKASGMSENETNLKTMPLHMKASIDFDLDPKTRHTLAASATSEGGFELFVKEDPEAYFEEKFKGRTNLELVGHKVGALGH